MFTCQHKSLQVNILIENQLYQAKKSSGSAKALFVVKCEDLWYNLPILDSGEQYGYDHQVPGRRTGAKGKLY